ncbi:hypothetical protein EWM64_g2804 [Hericium alpestre]|uniref:Cytochrome P450 n=1 Tax=Hericium alpestre TaxID=135208 RepID=A0A4Z0A4G0_9AGAM|nr:hypothetical protein EWM64_g2804 [Hericium alpestre]
MPSAFMQHICLTAGAIIILMISHGYAIREHDDPFIDAADKATDHFTESTKLGAFLVDSFPLLRFVPEWAPSGGWKKIAREWLVDMNAMVDLPHAYVKDRMSVSSIHSFFLAMTLYLEVQGKAQAELDAVVGHNRLPTLSDSEQLPYINALVKEVFRWSPVGPVGINMLYIRKFLHDEHVYHDLLKFIPDHFIASEDKEAELDPHAFNFGFGRCVCPGMYLADLSVLSACAMILAAFNILKVVEGGVTIEPKVKYNDGLIR